MSPMLDVQQAYAEMFRLRFGDSRGTNGAPRKLTDSMRVTSPSNLIVEAFSATYGGEVSQWQSPKGPQFEAYLPITAMPILVLPGQVITQWWERYRGSVCDRRCDGTTEQLTGEGCLCPVDIEARMADRNACRPMTRVNVMCYEVAENLTGAFVSHGLTVARTLPQSVAFLVGALERGYRVPAVLRVHHHPGKRDYVLPQIEVPPMTRETLERGDAFAIGNGAPAQISGAETKALARGGAKDVGSGTGMPVTREPKAGVHLPPGLASPPQPPLPHEIEGAAADPPSGPAPAAPSDDEEDIKTRTQKVVIWCKDAGLNDDGRHHFLRAFSRGKYASAKDVPAEMVAQLRAALIRYSRGELVIVDDAGGTPALQAVPDNEPEQPTLTPAPAVVDVPLPEPGAGRDQDYWLQLAPNLKQSQIVKQAKAIGDELGVKVTTLANVPTAVAERLERWIGEQG